MDLYLITLAVGAVGMLAMAFGGGARAKGGACGHAGHSGHASHGGRGLRAPGRSGGSSILLELMSPRVLFSVCVGFGASGLLLRPLLSDGTILFGSAFALGIVFERALVTPLWNFAFRFASNPAVTLESAIMSDATAVTAFDANGQGLIAVEVDGRLVQVLGTLQNVDRELRSRVVAGSRLRIEAVDAERNRCTVSLR